MKTTRLLSLTAALIIAAICGTVSFTGCATPPSQRQTTEATLKVVGLTAKASIDAAALLAHDGKITRTQWEQVASFYDLRFQPAFRLAVAAARSGTDSPADPQLLAIAGQFATLVSELTTKK